MIINLLHGVIGHAAVEVASKMQRELTQERSEIDSLYTKIRRLEEVIDTLSKVSLRVRVCYHFTRVASSKSRFESDVQPNKS